MPIDYGQSVSKEMKPCPNVPCVLSHTTGSDLLRSSWVAESQTLEILLLFWYKLMNFRKSSEVEGGGVIFNIKNYNADFCHYRRYFGHEFRQKIAI